MAKKDRRSSLSSTTQSFEESVSGSASAMGASYTLVGAVLLLGAIGYGVDRWQGTSPWFLLTGLILGVIVGFYELVKATTRR
jgi:F0F1-type ATP synthase assembly protein I